jgi:hypothetical protein
MVCYRLAGQEIHFSRPVPELRPFKLTATKQGTADEAVPFVSTEFLHNEVISRTIGWVAGAQRPAETWTAPPGMLLRVAGGSDFYISPGGQEVLRANPQRDGGRLNWVDRQILLGPALVLALALHRTWCLHASAAIHKDRLIVLLGESGRGKSTLAAYLAADFPAWRLVADDILPVTMSSDGLVAWPRFPQLKLPLEAQPGAGLPERLMIGKVFVLTSVRLDEKSVPQLLPAWQAVQEYLGHTAGARLFEPDLLEEHLAFCLHAAGTVPVYHLPYTRRRDVLPRIKEQLESLC